VNLIRTVCIACILGLGSTPAFTDDASPPPPGGALAACKQDVQTLCPDVQPGGGRIAACLKSHAAQVTPDCKASMQAARARRMQQPSAGEAPVSTPPSK
jgi:hypothetical protein